MPTSPICIDASCVVRLIINADEQESPVLTYWNRWESEGRQLVAPSLFRYEVTNAFYRYQRAGIRSAGVTSRALTLALSLPIHYRDDPEIHQDALRFAGRFRLPAAHNAHYLALADRLGCEFWTTDRKLFNSVSRVLPWLRLIDLSPIDGAL